MVNKNKMNNIKRNRGYLIAIGSFSLIISIILGRLAVDIALINFFEGMFMGISFATNLGYLVIYSLTKKALLDEQNVIGGR